MGLILDSSILIAAERGKFDLAKFLNTRDEPVVGAAITASELLHGCHRTQDRDRLKRRLQYVNWALAQFYTVAFALEEARWHARIWARLASEGKMIGSHDLLIAATAVSLDFTLATLKLGEFGRVQEIKLVEKGLLGLYQPR